MGLTVIFNWKGSGRRVPRSGQEERLRGEGWGGTLTDEQVDKLKYAERKIKEYTGAETPFVRQAVLDDIGEENG